ncbi:MAG: putative membrane protein YedE/YeeE [Verrucomicrobiales bacterium]|jgi:uncharacterized membrane protein YedE/YeeE
MELPISTSSTVGLVLAAVFGSLFGALLHRGRVTDYNVIVNQFRLRDFTMLKVMLSAVVVGGIGVTAMIGLGWVEGFHIKATNMLALVLGSALFGAGMVIYGYCPGTGVAAVATGRIHALVGFFGMIAGGIAYAFSFPWLKANVISVGEMGKLRLTDITGLPDAIWLAAIAAAAMVTFILIERWSRRNAPSQQ